MRIRSASPARSISAGCRGRSHRRAACVAVGSLACAAMPDADRRSPATRSPARCAAPAASGRRRRPQRHCPRAARRLASRPPKHVNLKPPKRGCAGRAADRRRRDELRHLRDRARHRAGAEDRQLLRLPGRRRLLRRPRPSTGSSPDFVIQGGDPLGTGTGGPGYTVDEKPPGEPRLHARASWRWRRRSAEPPGRSGSQFFVVTGADAGLPPEYALVGKVSKGYGRGRADRQARRPGERTDRQADGHRRDPEDRRSSGG